MGKVSKPRGGCRRRQWKTTDLLDQDIGSRLELIASLSDRLRSIPRTRFSRRATTLVQVQRDVGPCLRLKSPLQARAIVHLASDLDELSSTGLVHGDICPRNICFDGSQYWLLDWEPSLRQIRIERATVIATYPYLAPSETRGSPRLTSLSDRVGLYLTLASVLTRNPPSGADALRAEAYALDHTCVQIAKAMLGGPGEILPLPLQNPTDYDREDGSARRCGRGLFVAQQQAGG